jgi:methyl-accepting chemotaxis protein
MQKQINGLEYHGRMMSIYEKVINFESKIYIADEKKLADLEARLITTPSFFSAITYDLKLYLKNNRIKNASAFLEQIEEIENQYRNTVLSIHQAELNHALKKAELRDLLINLKMQLLALSSTLSEIFDLGLYTNSQNEWQLDLILNQIPAYQNALSQFLSLNFNPFDTKVQAQLQTEIARLDKGFSKILSANQFLLEENNIQQQHKIHFEKFLNTASSFSSFLTDKVYEETLLKSSWPDIHKIGLQVMHRSQDLYHHISQNLKSSLSDEMHYYVNRLLLTIMFFIIGIVFVLTPYLAQAFRRPLAELKNVVEKLTKGDLSVRIPIPDSNEVGAVSKSFNETAEVYEQIMLATDQFAIDLYNYSAEIFSTAKRLEQNLDVKEIAVQDITQNSKNILKTVHDFSHHLPQMDSTIHLTAHQVHLGQESLSALESMMQKMHTSADNTVNALSSIKSEIDKITIVIHTLIMIADQISLLSLNTAIRASKTGLKKLGYTVIADKIRELADQTAYATLDMEENVHQIVAAVPEIVNDIDQFNQEIQNALEDSLTVRQHFHELFSNLQTQITNFQTINQEMQEQAKKTLEIDKAVSELINSAQKTTHSVRNLYVEIEFLHQATNNLMSMTKRFVKRNHESKNK